MLRFSQFIRENVSNQGITHLGKNGVAGNPAACGHKKAHITNDHSRFALSQNKCKKCEAKHEKMKALKAKLDSTRS